MAKKLGKKSLNTTSRGGRRKILANRKRSATLKASYKAWNWIVNLAPWIGARCELETTDGFYRKGKITGVQMQILPIGTRVVYLPVMLEMNDDPTDKIEFSRLKKLEILPPAQKDVSYQEHSED